MMDADDYQWVMRYHREGVTLEIQHVVPTEFCLDVLLISQVARVVEAFIAKEHAGDVLTFEEWHKLSNPKDKEFVKSIDRRPLRDTLQMLKADIYDAAQRLDLQPNESYQFWENVRGTGYRVKKGWKIEPWEYIGDTTIIIKQPDSPPPDQDPCPIEAIQEDWKAWRQAFDGNTRLATENLQEATSGLATVGGDESVTEGSIKLFIRVLSGYMLLVEQTDTGHDAISDEIYRFVGEKLPSHDPHGLLSGQMLDIMDCCCNWLVHQVRRTRSGELYRDLRKFCRASLTLFGPLERDTAGRRDAGEAPWFRYAFESALLIGESSSLATEELGHLEELLMDSYELLSPLWAAEYRAAYSEQLSQLYPKSEGSRRTDLLLQAAAESEEVAILAMERGNSAYAAALFARAGRCYEEIKKHGLAFRAIRRASELMTSGKRLSARAAQYYEFAAQNAASLGFTELDKAASELAGKALLEQERLEEGKKAVRERVGEKPPKLIVIIANSYDQDTADYIVDPLLKNDLYPVFRDPKSIPALDTLASGQQIRGIIIVGGIQAHDTGIHLRTHFYDVPSKRLTKDSGRELTFKELDVRAVARYADVWYKPISGKPIYVLAGLSRGDTARAVIAFCSNSNGLLDEFFGKVEELER